MARQPPAERRVPGVLIPPVGSFGAHSLRVLKELGNPPAGVKGRVKQTRRSGERGAIQGLPGTLVLTPHLAEGRTSPTYGSELWLTLPGVLGVTRLLLSSPLSASSRPKTARWLGLAA